tara:strand:+ start:395 stop:766 length:372 start_codon:yes stop_codon:yes gene_type:complete
MIYTAISKYEMIVAFRDMGRLKTPDKHGNFTEEAIKELYDYYDEIVGEYFELSQKGRHLEQAYELDVVGICCEWTQWDNIDEVRQTYFYDAPETYDDDDVFEYLQDNTYHIVLSDDSILVREF